MGKYTRRRKRISFLDTVKDNDASNATVVLRDVVGPNGGEWVTAVDNATNDTNYKIPMSRLVPLTTGGVVSAKVLPGSYGPQGHAVIGQMKSDGFYKTGSSTKEVPSVSNIYIDMVTYDAHAITYRWIESDNVTGRYVVTPNTFRLEDGYGLKIGVSIVESHREGWLDTTVGSDIPASESVDLPDKSGTKSLSADRSIGYDSSHRLVHGKQDAFKNATDDQRKFGLSSDTAPGFGKAFNTLYVKEMSHVTKAATYAITFPSTVAGSSYGLVKVDDGNGIEPIGAELKPGTSNGIVALADHVHGCSKISITGNGGTETLLDYSLATSGKTFDYTNILKVTPPSDGSYSAGAVYRTDVNDRKKGAWRSITSTNGYNTIVLPNATFSNYDVIYPKNSTYVVDGETKTMSYASYDGTQLGGYVPSVPGPSVYVVTAKLGITITTVAAEWCNIGIVLADGITLSIYDKNYFTIDCSLGNMAQWFSVSMVAILTSTTPSAFLLHMTDYLHDETTDTTTAKWTANLTDVIFKRIV